MSISEELAVRVEGQGDRLEALEVQEGGGGKHAILIHDEASGVNGGGQAGGSWSTRTLDTERYDPNGLVSLSSNEFTPIAGTYVIHWTAVWYRSGGSQTRLQNITGATTVDVGSTVLTSATASNGTTNSTGFTVFTANGTDAYAIQGRCSTTSTSTGWGVAASFGEEVYMQAHLTKIG